MPSHPPQDTPGDIGKPVLPGAPGIEVAPGALPELGGRQEIGAGFAMSNPTLVSPMALTKQFQAMRDFDEVSALPSIPNSVKTQILASSELSDDVSVRTFLHQLENDLNEAELEVEEAREVPTTPDSQLSDDFELRAADNIGNDFRRKLFDVVGGDIFNRPSVVAGDPYSPVLGVKAEAVRRGILPEDTPMNDKWNAAVNNAYYEVQNQKLGEYLQGERFGAESSGGFLSKIDKWLSPSSLLSTAFATITADLVPNIGNISKGWEGWGNNISAWLADPFDVRKFGAALGPVDDIVFPVMNVAMLASGIGGIAGFGRAAWLTRGTALTGIQGSRNLSFLQGDVFAVGSAGASSTAALGAVGTSTKIDRLLGTTDKIAALARGSQPGLTAGLLGRVGERKAGSLLGSNATRASNSMTAWRSRRTVQVARKAVGEGMKVGFVAQLEAQISPDREVGLNPFGTLEQTQAMRIEQYQNWRTDNPVAMGVAGVMEMAFTPMTFFKPGRFSGPLKDGFKVAENVPIIGGRRVLPGWSTVTELLAKNPILQTAEGVTTPAARSAVRLTQATSSHISQMVKENLVPETGGVFNLKDLRRLKGDPTKEVEYFFTGQIDNILAGKEKRAQVSREANEKALYVFATIGIDNVARSQAEALVPRSVNLGKHDRTYIAIRGQLEARIRDLGEVGPTLDPNNPAHYSAYLASQANVAGLDMLDPANAEVMRLKAKDLRDLTNMADDNLDKFLRVTAGSLRNHQRNAVATMNDLLDTVTPEVLSAGLAKQGPTLVTEWKPWLSAVDDIEVKIAELEGGLDISSLRQAFAEEVDKPWVASVIGTELNAWLPMTSLDVNLGPLDRMAANIDAMAFAVTPGGVNTATRQEAIVLHDGLQQMVKARDNLATFSNKGKEFGRQMDSLAEYAWGIDPSMTAGDLTPAQVRVWANRFAKQEGARLGEVLSDVDRIAINDNGLGISWLDNNGYSITGGYEELNRRLRTFNNADFWGKFKVDTTSFAGGEGQPIGRGLTTIEKKISDLGKTMNHLGVEVDLPMADGSRYRAVAGNSFLQFNDVRNSMAPLIEIQRKTIQRLSLGTFLNRTEDTVVNGLRQVAFRQSLSANVQEFFDWNPTTRQWTAKRVDKVVNGRTTSVPVWDGPANFDPTPGSADMKAIERDLDSIFRTEAEAIAALRERTGSVLGTATLNMTNNARSYNKYEINPATLSKWIGGSEQGNQQWGKVALGALQGAMKKSRSIGWEYRGLAEVGDKIVQESWLRQAMGVMKYTAAGDAVNTATKVARTATGIGTHSNQVDLYRHWKAAGLALAIGTFQGVDAALDGEGIGGIAGKAALGAAVGAGAAELGSQLEGTGSIVRTAGRAAAFMGGSAASDALGGGDFENFAAGAVASTLGVGILRGVSTAGHNLMVSEGIGQYSVLGERFERIRNQVRFSLSPVFDAQRYTEGLVLSGTTTFTDSKGIRRQAPLALRPFQTAIKDLPEYSAMNSVEAGKALRADFQNAAKGREWTDALTAADARLGEVGILGFSPVDAMAGTWAQLRAAGMDPQDAVDHVKRVYQYGRNARSGFEQSVNFVFFPFSFQKQYMSRMTSFFSEDLGRLMMVTNSLKALEYMGETTQFADFVEERLPGMRELRKINAFAYGFSPGQFGGINRPYIDLLRNTGIVSEGMDAVINTFLPQGLELESEGDVDKFMRQVNRALPLIRDLNDLKEDVFELGYVVTSPQFKLKKIDRQNGWDEYQGLKDEFNATAQQLGVSYATLRSNEEYRPFQEEFARKVRVLEREYPEWKVSKSEANQRAADRASELSLIKLNPKTPEEVALQMFDRRARDLKEIYGADYLDLPSQVQAQLRRQAQLLAAEEPKFTRLYDRFFARSLGPITLEL